MKNSKKIMSSEEGARKILKAKRRIQPQQVATSFSNVDWNIFFADSGFSLVTNQILEFLDYDSIKTCLYVSPIWKEYIDSHGQKILRQKKFFSLTTKKFFKDFPEWEKTIPYIKTKLNCFDLDILIDRFLCYSYHDYCPLHWAVRQGKVIIMWDVKFVEIMIRSPFDFNTLSFTGLSGQRNNVLHEAARKGHIEIVKLLLKHAEEKKIDINAKNDEGQSAINIAKDDPELLLLLMKHCKWDKTIFDEGKLRPKTLAALKETYKDHIKKE